MNHPDPTLLEIFSAEQAEHLQRMRVLVREMANPDLVPANPAAYEELLRRAHSLKGAARAVGFESTEMLTHSLEGAVTALRVAGPELQADAFTSFLRVFDTLEDIPAAYRAGRSDPPVADLLRELARISGVKSAALIVAPEPRPESTAEPAAAPVANEFVRINATWLDDLMRASAELVSSAGNETSESASSTRLPHTEAALREWLRLRHDAAPYIRSHLHDEEFTPVLECLNDAEKKFNLLLAGMRDEVRHRRQRDWELLRLTDRLEESALRVRMVTAETVLGGFGPMLRNLAKEHGKPIEFRAEGLDLPADRVVLQALKDPALHLLRNALSHGIESEEERLKFGKSVTGVIRLVLRSRGDRIVLTVEDDGRGLDYAALAEEAASHGLAGNDLSGNGLAGEVGTQEVGTQSEETLAALIFRPGFSTSDGVNTLSGRGMGLSIVRDAVDRLQGDIRVHSEPGKGVRVTISVPLSLSSQQILLVDEAGHTFGILTSFVERLCRVQKQDIHTLEGKPVVMIDSTPVSLVCLTSLLNLTAPVRPENEDEENDGSIQAAIVTAGVSRTAIAVERLVDVREAVIKSIGLPPEESGASAGAVPMPDGRVAVILNVPEMAGRLGVAGAAAAKLFAPSPETRRRRILVVDDSITTRSLEKSLLEANGYDVEVAVDGVEALEKLLAGNIELVITDLMMPRMDGFELLENIRRDKHLAKLPVIIVSSMESREDQERGLALGADAYVLKRKFDQRELLKTVGQIL